MSELKAFNCPSCGAPLTITGSEIEVVCPYCGTTVVVPAELRSKPASPVAPQPIVQPEVIIVPQYAAPRTAYRARRSGCGSLAFMLLILAGIIGYILRTNPGLMGALSGAILSGNRALNAAASGFAPVVSGGIGKGPGKFTSIDHFALDPGGNFYISDSAMSLRIQKFDANGKYVGSWNLEESNPGATQWMTVDKDGNVYAVEDGMILKYNGTSTKLLAKIGGTYADVGIDHYYTVVATAQGPMWTITYNGDLLHLDPQGKVLDRVANPFKPFADQTQLFSAWAIRLAIGKSGNLYTLIDSYNRHPKVLVFSPDGKKVLAKFGDGGDTPGDFDRPFDIAVDSQGHYLRNLPLKVSGHPFAYRMQYDGKGSLFAVIDSNAIYKYDVSSTSAQ